MSDSHRCSFGNCNKVFAKAYELKKHVAIHENPDSVHYCPQCEFFTLQKKNLVIHHATHTGVKMYQCPHMDVSPGTLGAPPCEERCEYRTNDPAALTKHRKKVHAYVPPLNRSRRPNDASATGAPRRPRKPRQKQGGKPTHPRPPKRLSLIPCLKPSRVPCLTDSSNGGTGHTTTLFQPTEGSFFVWQAGMSALGKIDASPSSVSGHESSISNSITLVPNQEMDLDTPYDASLNSEWLAKYEMSYSMFDETEMPRVPGPLQEVLPLGPPVVDDRVGCLCPEWMVEAGIEGWNRSVLETRQEIHVLDD